jgi:hydrogenase maturation protease
MPVNPEIPPVLVFAVGNESRGDDALGPSLLRKLNVWLNSGEGRREKREGFVDQFELLEDFQLQIEHAMDMKDRRLLLFIDAGMETPSPFSFYRAQPGQTPVLYSHALTPEALLKVYTQFYQETPPDAFILCIRGASFELGEPPSPAAMIHLAQAQAFVQQLLLEPDATSWDRLCTTSILHVTTA